MPVYEFESEDGTITEAVVRPVSRRDDPVEVSRGGRSVRLRRRTVPSRLGFVVAAKGEPTMDDQVRAGYYRAEQEQGSRFRSQFSKKKLKKIWE